MKNKTTIVNKEVLSGYISDKSGLHKKDAKIFIDAFIDVVKDVLVRGERIQLVGFGSFEVVERAGRMGVNPKDGTPLEIMPSKTPKFKPGKGLKDAVNV